MPPPAVSGLRVKAPASLIEPSIYVITAIIGIALSVIAFLVINHLNASLAQQHRERELSRLTHLAGQQLRLLTHQALNETRALALRLGASPTGQDRFDSLAQETLERESGLNNVLWLRLAAEAGEWRIVHIYPASTYLDLPRENLRWSVSDTDQPAIVTAPAATRPNFHYALILVRLSSGEENREWIATVIDFDRFHSEVAKSLDTDGLQLRIYDAAESAQPRHILYSPGTVHEGLSRSEETLIGNHPWLLEITTPANAAGIVTESRSAWIALGSGLLLTLIALSYLTVLRRHALLFAKMQQKLGKKLAHQARQEAERDLRLKSKAIEASHNAIVITDATRARQPIIYVNNACVRMTGYTREELLGRAPDLLLAHERNQPAMVKLRTAIKNGTGGSAAIRCYRKDGSMFWNELSISPVADNEGQITHILGVMSDITDRKRFADQLLYQATHDQLTGLPNRNLMQDRLEQAIAHAKRNDTNCGLLLLNVDRLKAINESLGHRFGNQVLKSVAERLTNSARSCDTIARLSGDEFVVVLPELNDADEMLVVAQRVLNSFSEGFSVEAHELTITCSIGGCAFPKDGSDTESLLRNADIAMGRAKQKGKNRFEFFTEKMNVNAIERLKLENDLRHAVENNELFLHYQPRVDLSNGEIVALEALVRWQHPSRGLIPPGLFIPVAEEAGMIHHIGDWVLHAACEQIRAWEQQNLSSIAVAVNLSALQLQRRELQNEIETALRDYNIGGKRLELEITESSVMENAADTVHVLEQLKALEVQLAIDDFGTGYSSLAYLRRFPFDYLKIDRSFIANLTQEPDEASIARTIIAMAHSLRMKVIAEGVETEAQARYLQRNHCDEMQGYLFSKPVPADMVSEMLREQRTLFDSMPLQRISPRSILIVDDEVESLNALRRVLRREGYNIMTTPNPLEGLELLATQGAEVVISDQLMPEMSGVEFLSRVRELHPNTIRIELTGSTDIRAAAELVNRGAIFRFLTKPCDDEDLRRNVREAFKQFENNQRLKEAFLDEQQ